MRYVIDGEGKVLGRLGSQIAKMLLNGDEIVLLNAEKICISGHMQDIIAKYKQRIELKDKANPEHSPYYSRRPDLFVKRAIRGMLPYRKPRGREAYGRLRVYVGIPEDLKDAKAHRLESKNADEAYESAITVSELTSKLGYR